MKLPTQIPLCGRRPPVLGALIDVMEKHTRPFVLQMAQENRHELVSAIQLLANNLKMTPIILNAANTSEITQYLLEKERNLIVIIESEAHRISHGMQSLILERYEPSVNSSEIRQLIAQGMSQENIRSHLPKRNPPAGLLIITDVDPGELCQAGDWSRDFTSLKHFTLRWDNLPQRPDAYQALFKAWLMVSAKEFGIDLDPVLDLEAVKRYAWMQKILVSHAKNAGRRGMTLQAHQTVDEVMLAARDCVRYVSNGKNRRIDATVVEALVFKGVTREALIATFGLDQPKRKRGSDTTSAA